MSEQDASLSNPAITSDESAVASQQAQLHTSTNIVGSAILDAQAAVSGNKPEGDSTNYPIATNFTTADAIGDPKTAGASGVMGSYSKDELVADKGSTNLHNNPDISSDQMQRTLFNTDPIWMPTDSEPHSQD